MGQDEGQTGTVIEYTEQQIDDHCLKLDKLCFMLNPDGRTYYESLQIIRQLQEELRESFIVKRRYVDVMWEMPQGDINASVEQLQGLVQELLEKEVA